MRQRIICIFAFFIIVSSLLTNVAFATSENWNMFHHDAAHGGVSYSDAPDINNVLWTYDTESTISWSSPAVVNGYVYIGAKNGKCYSINAYTGLKQWEFTTGGSIESSPALSNNKLYIGSDDHKLYCLDAETGEKEWEFETGDYIRSSPVVVDGRVYVGSYDKKIYCIDANQGSKFWETTTSYTWEHSSPVVVANFVYIGTYCLHASNGTVKYTGSYFYSYDASPTYSDGKLVIGKDSGTSIYCYSADDGELSWQKSIQNNAYSTPAILDGKIYIGTWAQPKQVFCLDLSDGEELWGFNADAIVDSSPAVADGKVYFGSWNIGSLPKRFYCVDANTGIEIWNYSIGSTKSSPAVYDKMVFISTNSGIIYCFRDNTAPQTPTQPIGTSTGSPDSSYSYTTTSSDTEGDAIQYFFNWGDDTNTGWVNDPSAPHSWVVPGVYKIKVKVKDTYGLESSWSPELEVTITDPTIPLNHLSIAVDESVMEQTEFLITIKDQDTLNSISGALVTFNHQSQLTDSNGNVRFMTPDIAVSTSYSITVSAKGYASASTSIIVENQETPIKTTGVLYGTIQDTYSNTLEDGQICIQLQDELDTAKQCIFQKQHDELGFYYNKQLQTGTYAITASCIGFLSDTKIITISQGDIAEINFKLEQIIDQKQILYDENTILFNYVISDEAKKQNAGAKIETDSEIISLFTDGLDLSINENNMDIFSFTVSAADDTGRKIFFIETGETFTNEKNVDDIIIEYDGQRIERKTLSYLLHADITDDTPIWAGLTSKNEQGENVFYFAILVPHFSEHTITISSIVQGFTGLMAYLVYISISLLALILFLSPRIRNIARRYLSVSKER